MYFQMIGNMNTYLRSMEMKNMWDLKKQSGDYSKGGLSLDQWLAQTAKEAEESKQDEKLSEILMKVYTGKKLTPEEREYLRDKAPQVYKELVNMEEEQKAYERELRRCETKEEVERLRMNRINAALTTVRAVDSNPNIPESKKMEIICQEKRRLDAVNESTQKFIRSGAYAKLPTEAEKAAVEKEQMERLRGEHKEDGSQVQEKDEALLQEEAVTPEAGQQGAAEDSLEVQDKKPEIDIESEEERKVRRAKANAAYAALQSPEETSVEASAAGLYRMA